MNIYLDVDGTILTKNHKPAKNLEHFLNWALSKGDVYWLTTHCKENDNKAVLRYLEPILTKQDMSLIQKVMPSEWTTLKTEAINFNEKFLWFDDYLLFAEQEELRKKGVLKSWIKIDLNKIDLNNIAQYTNLFN